jgi:hypothetical protein
VCQISTVTTVLYFTIEHIFSQKGFPEKVGKKFIKVRIRIRTFFSKVRAGFGQICNTAIYVYFQDNLKINYNIPLKIFYSQKYINLGYGFRCNNTNTLNIFTKNFKVKIHDSGHN